MTMEMFLKELCTAVKNMAVENNLNVDSAYVDNDELTINVRTDNGTRYCIDAITNARYCINSHRFIFWPCDKHKMMIEEIWIGYDKEGYPWSDHMGDLTVDCTGLKSKGAIDKIVEKFIEKATK